MKKRKRQKFVELICTILGLCLAKWFIDYYNHRPVIDRSFKKSVCFEYRSDSTAQVKNIILIPIDYIYMFEDASQSRSKLDSLKRVGYVTFNERIYETSNCSDTTKYYTYTEAAENIYTGADPDSDTLIFRKIRRIMDAEMEWSDYHFRVNKGYLPKTDQCKCVHKTAKMLGINSDRDYWVDYTTGDLIKDIEQKTGPIELSEYDYKLPVEQGLRYKSPEKSNRELSWMYEYDLRREYLYRKIKNAPFDKIAVIYGGAHIRTLKKWMAEDPHFTKMKDFHL